MPTTIESSTLLVVSTAAAAFGTAVGWKLIQHLPKIKKEPAVDSPTQHNKSTATKKRSKHAGKYSLWSSEVKRTDQPTSHLRRRRQRM